MTEEGRTQEAASQAAAEDRPLSGAQKAAVFILALEEEDASLVLRNLSDEELARVTNEIAALGMVEKETVASVLEEFLQLEQLHGLVREGGMDQAIRLVETCFPRDRARRILQSLMSQRQRYPLLCLDRVDTEAIAAFLEDEPPPIIATVLANMNPMKAGEVLDRLSPQLRREVVERIAGLEPANAEALEQVELALERYLRAAPSEPSGAPGGAKAVARILRASRSSGSSLLSELREERPELAEEIGKHLADFEGLARLDDRTVQLILRDVDVRVLAVALKGAGESLRQKFARNLSRRAADQLAEEMAACPRASPAEIEEARRIVLRAAAAHEHLEPLAAREP